MPHARDSEPQPTQHAFERALRESRVDVVPGHKIRCDGDSPAIALDDEITELEVFDSGILECLVVSVTLSLVRQEIIGRRGVIFNSQHLADNR